MLAYGENTRNMQPHEFLRHLSFGFDIHRCMVNRLAEMQLCIVWEEILARFLGVDMGASKKSNLFVSARKHRAQNRSV